MVRSDDAVETVPRHEQSLEFTVTRVEVVTGKADQKLEPATTYIFFSHGYSPQQIKAAGTLPLEKDDTIRAYWRSKHETLEIPLKLHELGFHTIHKIEKLRNGAVMWTYHNESAY